MLGLNTIIAKSIYIIMSGYSHNYNYYSVTVTVVNSANAALSLLTSQLATTCPFLVFLGILGVQRLVRLRPEPKERRCHGTDTWGFLLG